MSTAYELIQTVIANGGRMWVEGGDLVIAPVAAGRPIVDRLRQHKREIISLLKHREVDSEPAPEHDPEAWLQSFIWWLNSICSLHPRLSGGVGALHYSFCDWQIACNDVPCNRRTFQRLLADSGFRIYVADGVLLVSGLTFRDDAEATERYAHEDVLDEESPVEPDLIVH